MRFCVVLLGAALAASGALAQSPDRADTATFSASDIQAAQLLMSNQRLDDAKRLLEHVLVSRPDDSQVLFLLGTIAVAQKDYDAAVLLFRRILAREPDAERVRLELARAFYLKGDYDNADRQFRFARAGDINDAVKGNIDQFLSAINRLREWTVNFSFALAPDTNQNAATSANQVSIFGMSFALDPAARSQSGIGVAGNIGGEWSPLLGDNLKARIGGDLNRVEYSRGQFDDMTLSVYGGPQWLYSNWDVSVLAVGFQRWYANRDFLSGIGGKLAADYGITSDFLAGASIGVQNLTNTFIPEQSGPLWSVQVQGTYVMSPSSLFQVLGGFNRQDAGSASYSYNGVWLGAGYQQDLPLGFLAGLQPSYYMTRYDAALSAFGRARSDNTVMLALTFLNRRFDFHGFTPRISWVYTDQHSNIALYSYSRSQFQIGVTSLF